VVPNPDTQRSTLENAWTRQPGIAPLMQAVGAATIPLTPSRHIVIAEGPSDALLLPSLIREAGRLRTLPFQIVSGLAEASEAVLRRLEKEAQYVAFLADGDGGGSANLAMLPKIGIAKRRIIQFEAGLCLEDLVDPALYIRALNSYFDAWYHKSGITVADLTPTQRPAAVKRWCDANGLKKPDKLLVAQEILRHFQADDSSGRRLADASRRAVIKKLYGQLLDGVRIPRKEAAAFAKLG
jgi:predicted ATP-dependent endonuclease of OLD family